MENERFDAVVKRLEVVRVTRGSAIRSLLGGGAAVLLGTTLSLEAADAGNKRNKNQKNKKKNKKKAQQRVSSQAYANPGSFTGQGFLPDGFGGYDLRTERCGTANGADADGPYLLWVLTATGAKNAEITGPWGTAAMTKTGNGTFKYVSEWYDPDTLPGAVSATYDGKAKNAQLVVSHGCRPFVRGAWCSPGFWHNATDTAWALTGISKDASFNSTVYDEFYGVTLASDATLITVLTTNGGTYKGPGTSGTNPETQAPNEPLNPFNATGAKLSNELPGYDFSAAVMEAGASDACPIDHFGNFKA